MSESFQVYASKIYKCQKYPVAYDKKGDMGRIQEKDYTKRALGVFQRS
jgi:hypothetical protein